MEWSVNGLETATSCDDSSVSSKGLSYKYSRSIRGIGLDVFLEGWRQTVSAVRLELTDSRVLSLALRDF